MQTRYDSIGSALSNIYVTLIAIAVSVVMLIT